MRKDKKNKKCPFCGGNSKVSIREAEFLGFNGMGVKIRTFFVQVLCNRCLARGPIHRTPKIIGSYTEKEFNEWKKIAIALWNKRWEE